VKQHAEIADAADAGLRTHGRQAGFDTRVAERAFFRLAGHPIEVNLLVRAGRDAHAPAAAFVLVNQDNAGFRTPVDGAGRTRGHAGRVEAMLAQARQIHHERVFELAVNVLLDVFEVVVLAALVEFATENLLPVRPPGDLVHGLAGDQ